MPTSNFEVHVLERLDMAALELNAERLRSRCGVGGWSDGAVEDPKFLNVFFAINDSRPGSFLGFLGDDQIVMKYSSTGRNS